MRPHTIAHAFKIVEGADATYSLNYSLVFPNSYVEIFTPPPPQVPQNVTLFGDVLFKGEHLKMRSLGWTLIQRDSVIVKGGKFGHRDMHGGRQWEGTKRISYEHEDGHL